jgi:hypothetical protein
MNKWVFLLVIILVAGAVVTLTMQPVSRAMADRVNMQTQVDMQERAVLSDIRQAEKQATSAARTSASIALWSGFVAVVLVIVIAVAFRAGGDMVTSLKTAQLPVARQIAPGAYVALIPPDNKPWLIDAYSGRRALLSEATDVDEVRAQIMGRQLTVDRLAEAAESIAAGTGSPAPADWLPHIGSHTLEA